MGANIFVVSTALRRGNTPMVKGWSAACMTGAAALMAINQRNRTISLCICSVLYIQRDSRAFPGEPQRLATGLAALQITEISRFVRRPGKEIALGKVATVGRDETQLL